MAKITVVSQSSFLHLRVKEGPQKELEENCKYLQSNVLPVLLYRDTVHVQYSTVSL